MSTEYKSPGPTREEVDILVGAAILQFGTDPCGFCRSAEPIIIQALSNAKDLIRVKVEDGPGRPLGRSFRVKLWPTLIFLKHGKETGRVVRPASVSEIELELAKLFLD